MSMTGARRPEPQFPARSKSGLLCYRLRDLNFLSFILSLNVYSLNTYLLATCCPSTRNMEMLVFL